MMQVVRGRNWRKARSAAVCGAVVVLLGLAAPQAEAKTQAGLVFKTGSAGSTKALTGASLTKPVEVYVGGSTAGVASVDFFLDDPSGQSQPVAKDPSAPFGMKLNPSAYKAGKHSLLAVLRSSSGTVATMRAQFTVKSASASRANGVKSRNAKCVAPAGARLQDWQLDDGDYPWAPSSQGEVTVYFDAGKLQPKEYTKYFVAGARAWSTSPCIEAKVVNACPPGSNCVTVNTKAAGDEGDDGVFNLETDDTYLTGGELFVYTNYTKDYSDFDRQVLVSHEMGHALGLAHRKNTADLMTSDGEEVKNMNPDKVDFDNLLVLYGSGKKPSELLAAARGWEGSGE